MKTMVIICIIVSTLIVIPSYINAPTRAESLSGIFLITNNQEWKDAGFNLSGLPVYNNQGLTEFWMPVALKKEDVSNLKESDIEHTIKHANDNFNSRLQSITFEILESETYWVVLYNMQVKASNKTFSIDFIPKIKGEELHQFAWWNSSWTYYKPIAIPNTFIDVDLTNFPVLVVIDSTTGAKCNNGDSLRFVPDSNSTMEYPHQIDEWNDGGTSYVWVNLTHVESSSYNTQLNMYYGNSGASSNSSTDVWDSHFLAVYHLNASTTTTSGCYDFTANANHATYGDDLPTNVGGEVGVGQDFDGVNDRILFPDGAWLPVDDDYGTAESWTEADSPNTWYQLFTMRDDGTGGLDQWYWRYGAVLPGYRFAMHSAGAEQIYWDEIGGPTTTNYEYHVCAMAKDNFDFWTDNTIEMSDRTCNMPTAAVETSIFYGFGVSHTLANDFDGEADELRLSDIKRSEAWINASYDTINNNATFLLWGGEITNEPPTTSGEAPVNNSIDIDITTQNTSIIVDDPNGGTVDVYFYNYTGTSWVLFGQNLSVDVSVEPINVTQSNINYSEYSTTYTWTVNVTDGANWLNETYSFTTEAAPTAPPTLYFRITNPYPANESIDICPRIDYMGITIATNSTNNMNLSFYRNDSQNITFYVVNIYSNIPNGAYNFCLDGHIDDIYYPLCYNETYHWYVNLSEYGNSSNYNVSSIYDFTTAENPEDCVVESSSVPLDTGMSLGIISGILGGIIGSFILVRKKKKIKKNSNNKR